EPLCLDEIGETSAETQLYLLRILEEQSARLHGPHPPAQSLRVLSLTNRAMRDEVEAGRFRRDLFYRLSTVVLTIPPLHARGEDVLLIAEHYIRKISMETGRDRLQLAPEVQDALMAHVWPGNVRELRNLVSGLHVLAKSRMVTLADLPPEITTPTLPNAGLVDPADAQDQLLPIGASLKHAEIRLIENALKHHHGNLSKAAIALGISRPTLYRKIEAYGIRAS
ncbi:MAG: helix-turn-helix domain-containing protein, partial [Cypionkella sp.]|uniref:sigma 54-interacting transcriptional regulator n=1 Tax=Cypionkella sp. TaxID=2811411 RepID=UPI002ABA7522